MRCASSTGKAMDGQSIIDACWRSGVLACSVANRQSAPTSTGHHSTEEQNLALEKQDEERLPCGLRCLRSLLLPRLAWPRPILHLRSARLKKPSIRLSFNTASSPP